MAKRPDDPGNPRPPSVERVLAAVREGPFGGVDAIVLRDAARDVLSAERARLQNGDSPASVEVLGDELEGVLAARERSLVETLIVINATGVIIHTNLGRAPWPLEVAAAAADAANNYLLLELDRETGRRGSRFRAAEDALVELTGAEDAFVTNASSAPVSSTSASSAARKRCPRRPVSRSSSSSR